MVVFNYDGIYERESLRDWIDHASCIGSTRLDNLVIVAYVEKQDAPHNLIKDSVNPILEDAANNILPILEATNFESSMKTDSQQPKPENTDCTASMSIDRTMQTNEDGRTIIRYNLPFPISVRKHLALVNGIEEAISQTCKAKEDDPELKADFDSFFGEKCTVIVGNEDLQDDG